MTDIRAEAFPISVASDICGLHENAHVAKDYEDSNNIVSLLQSIHSHNAETLINSSSTVVRELVASILFINKSLVMYGCS